MTVRETSARALSTVAARKRTHAHFSASAQFEFKVSGTFINEIWQSGDVSSGSDRGILVE